MADLLRLPVRNDDGDAHVVVETPRGSAAKLYDPELQAFTLSKALILGLTYPYDWGFIPSTKGEDGDPIDVLVLHDTATAPGLVLKCKIIGVLEVLQSEKGKKPIRNDVLSRCRATRTAKNPTRTRGAYPSRCDRKLRNSSSRRMNWRRRLSNFSAGKGRRPAST